MTFADLKNRHAGQTISIFGTGPSLDNVDPKKVIGPRIFLNRAAFGDIPHGDAGCYWLVQDDAWGKGVKGPWSAFLSSVKFGCGVTGVFLDYLLGVGGTPPAPAGPNIVHFGNAKHGRDALLGMDRDQIAERGQLYMMAGTGCTAVHLAWYLGAPKVVLAGLDGGDGYAKRLSRFYDAPAKGGSGYAMARQQVMRVISAKGLEYEEVAAKEELAQ